MSKLGAHFLGEYKKSFEENKKLTITWDIFVQILGTGTSDGRLGVMLYIIGMFLMYVGAIIFLMFIITVAPRFIDVLHGYR